MGKQPEKEKKGFILKRQFQAQRPINREGMVERLIQEGIESGKFSNLVNEGRPIKLEEDNPYVEEDMRLAYKIMANAGVTPPWVDQEKEVEAEIARLRQEREQHRLWLIRRLDDIKQGPYHYFMRDVRQLGQSHQRWLADYTVRLHGLNEKIHSFNHICPVDGILKTPIHVENLLRDYERSCPAIPQV